MLKTLLAAVVLTLSPLTLRAEGNALHNLPKPEKPRFEVTDRDWPRDPGQASICLWKDDKLAAVSITIDDNQALDQPWWLEMSKKYDFRPTWFVISRRVGMPPNGGTWADFIKLHNAGHDIQSHTVDHFSPSFKDILPVEENYSRAIKEIEAGVPGIKVQTLAFPGGAKPDPNDPAIAAKYYIAARGTFGTFNEANLINYTSTNSISGTPPLNADHKWAGLPNTIALNPGQKKIFRAWVSVHYHNVGPEEKARKPIIDFLEYLKQHNDAFWNAPFTEVAKYGEERDTATLDAKPSTSDIQFTLTDRMDDTQFDFPLTIKVRINNAWKQVIATQAGKPIPATLIDHAGNKYALIATLPDRGPVTITKQN